MSELESTFSFTDAVRAVLTEMDIDNLPTPITIKATYPTPGVEVHVTDFTFGDWVEILSNRSAEQITTPEGYTDSKGVLTEHILVGGRVGDFYVAIVTVRPVATAGAVA